jgi:hypothetical protein
MKYAIRNPTESAEHVHERRKKGVTYDAAWAARVTGESGKPLFPECVQWLLENQKSDGSWGCQIQNYHDQLFSTLSTVIALKKIDRKRYKNYIQKGEIYIWENLKKLELDSCKLVASALLFSSLMEISKAFSCFNHTILPPSNTNPELWNGKVLNCPLNVVLSSIVSASIMYNTAAWKLCSGWSV